MAARLGEAANLPESATRPLQAFDALLEARHLVLKGARGSLELLGVGGAHEQRLLLGPVLGEVLGEPLQGIALPGREVPAAPCQPVGDGRSLSPSCS